MSNWAVIPVKDFSRAKTRLSGILSNDERALYAMTLFEHVFGVVTGSDLFDEVLVISDSEEIVVGVQQFGHEGLHAITPDGAGDAVQRAVDHAAVMGARTVTVVMADLPKLRPGDLEQVVAGLDAADVVLAPDRREEGTNILATRRPGLCPLSFGREDSFSAHKKAIEGLGLQLAEFTSSGTSLDVDTEADYLEATG